MDRKIPKEVLRKERNIKFIKLGAVILASVIAIAVVISLLRESINLKNIQLSTVDTGTIEVSVSASGKVVPAFEETIITPIESRIVEVYKKAGDSVDVGTPLVKLDLQSIETDYRKMLDELQMRQYRLEQQRIKNNSTLSNTEMQLKVNDMQIDKMQVEVRNERYLDSIGAGTTDKVRETELSYNVAKLEQEQARKKFENDKQVAGSELRVQELELEIFILSDLSHFKIDGEIADSYGDRISTGNKVVVRIGSEELTGVVSSVTPLSKNGVIQFSVQLEDDSHSRLRSGLKTDVYVMNAVKDDVMRIANGPYYSGPGTYELFMMNGNSLERRKVQLGESNYEFVEVMSGLKPGDRVVVSDMSQYRNKSKLKMKN